MSLPLPVFDPKLPRMRCDAGCDLCCGPALLSAAELDRIVRHAAERGVRPVRQGIKCPFHQGGRCAVYEVRPFVCRMYGHSPRMTCPKGYNVNVPPAMERKYAERHARSGRPDLWLHSLVYGEDEMSAVIAAYLSDPNAERVEYK